MIEFSVFNYCYRDASNYKAWGSLLLRGLASSAEIESLRTYLEDGEFFIAEQLGIPPLYAELWKFSNGPTADDHVWHTFYELRPATAEEVGVPVFDSVRDFIQKILAVKTWEQTLSPHWERQ